MQRFYYIDLLRALAIMMVFVAHSILSFGPAPWNFGFQFGGTGVELFFLLSGWLIGSQLYKEQQKFGSIDIKRFWFRRWMRTFPAYFAVLFFTLGQLYLTKESVPNPTAYFFFLQNYLTDLPFFYVSWSLSVEEQFYLMIAPTLVLLSRSKSINFQFGILLLILLSPSLFRFMDLYTKSTQTHVRWDCCVMGVLLAFIHFKKPKLWANISKRAFAVCAICVCIYMSFYAFQWFKPYTQYQGPSNLVLAFVFSGMLIFAIQKSVNKLPVCHAVIMHISTRSYSMYLLHPDALAVCKKFFPISNYFVFFTCSFIITMLASEILYRVIELPFIGLREKYKFSAKRTRSC
ncbi:acyltransferase family protein [Agaribacter marinus]|uniref:acyltransferase family protein n=1 Tax=Agaribacter marinus TaxID=1431249 RepID=UPI0024E0CB35|nr:acyltransferase [Agaribacter marinus]